MTKLPQDATIVGIDIAKRHLDVHVLPAAKSWRVEYTPKALAALANRLAALDPALIVMEASGGYERACADSLAGAGLAVAVVNPRQTRRFAGSTGKLAKTDRIDAQMIARYGQCINPAHRHSPDRAHAQQPPLSSGASSSWR